MRQARAAEADFFVALHFSVDAEVRGCPDEAEFRHSVAHRLGYDPFRDEAAIDVRVRVGGTATAVDGHVDWRKANGTVMGERRFVAKDGNCAKLLTEMSFAVALQIELLHPKAAAAASVPGKGASTTSTPATTATLVAPPPSGPSPATLPSAASPPAVPPELASPPEVPPATLTKPDEESAADRRAPEPATAEATPAAPRGLARRFMWVGLGPSLAWRISPALTGEGRLFFGFRDGDLSLELGVEATYPSTERRWDGSGFRQTLIGGGLALCGHHRWLSACALGRASEVFVTGLGVDNPRSPTGFVAQAGVRLGAAIELGGPWFAAAHVDGLGLLTSCTVELNQVAVWDMPRLGLLAGIDVLARFR